MNELQFEALGVSTRAAQFGAPDGAPLILVHGFRGDHHGLEGIARELCETMPEIRAIVPDLPGFGATPPIPGRVHDLDLYGEWLRAFVSTAAPGGHAILGHSFGSLVVSSAIDGGLAPSRAILVNPISSPALDGPQALLTRLAIAYYRIAELLPERPARWVLGHPAIVRAMSIVMAKTRDPEMRRWIHAQHAAYFSEFSDTATLAQAFEASVSHTVADSAPAYTMPTLIVAGERDDIAPLPAQLALHRRMPRSEFKVIPSVGHLVHYEAVSDAVAIIGRFLRANADSTAGER